MDLLTKEIEAALDKHPLYSQDGKGGKALVLAKFFLPGTAWTWYILEGGRIELDADTAAAYGVPPGPSWEFFGITCNEHTPGGEYGYIMLAELQAIKLAVPVRTIKGDLLGTIPQRVERDQHFKPKTIAEIGGLNTYDD